MKTVVFDLDGTLVESHRGIVASINHVRRHLYGLPPLEESIVVHALNEPGVHLPKALYGDEDYEDEAKELFEKEYAVQCLEHAKPYDGVVSLLERLKAKDCDLFVATNAPTATSVDILSHNNIEHFFTDIIGADRVKRPKPSAEMLRLVLRTCRYDECLMIGDSAKDMEAAIAANVQGVFAKWGYGILPAEMSRSCTEVSNPEEVYQIICEDV